MKNTYPPVLIIGCGLSGLTVALEVAKKKPVVLLTKDDPSLSATAWAQGGIVHLTKEEKSIKTHIDDTVIAGDGLVDGKAAEFFAYSGHQATDWLINNGVVFSVDNTKGNTLHLVREGGHSVPRIAHSGDATGKAILKALLKKAFEDPNILIKKNMFVIDLIDTQYSSHFSFKNTISGVHALNTKTQKVETIKASHVVLATGGMGKVYRYTSNPNVATGDGIALGWRIGCKIANLEFIQFHPTCLYHPGERTFLISEALRGAGATLENKCGERFMNKYDPRTELAPRDIVARSIDFEMKKHGLEHVYLNATNLEPSYLNEHFPTISKKCNQIGINIEKERIPVVPAAHYSCGGILTKLNGQTNFENLYAIGETACTGLHGANRLASNSLLECVITGIAAAKSIIKSDYCPDEKIETFQSSSEIHGEDKIIEIFNGWNELRSIMSAYVGIVRSTSRLRKALKRIHLLQEEVTEISENYYPSKDLIEVRNLVICAELITKSALNRKESRGLHFMKDHQRKSTRAMPTILRSNSII